MYKIIVLSCVLAISAAAIHSHRDEEQRYVPKYQYKYTVEDGNTEDVKTHWETRDGDRVRGSYKLMEPDGGVRTVEYVADSRNGFNAVVTQEKAGHKQVMHFGKAGEDAEAQRHRPRGEEAGLERYRSYVGGAAGRLYY